MLASSATANDSSATLSCELYGYFLEQLPTIVWNFGGDQLTNHSSFTIMIENGSRMIQNGGYTSQTSVRSILFINNLSTAHEGLYFCSADGFSRRSIIIQVVEGRLQYCGDPPYILNLFNLLILCPYVYM